MSSETPPDLPLVFTVTKLDKKRASERFGSGARLLPDGQSLTLLEVNAGDDFQLVEVFYLPVAAAEIAAAVEAGVLRGPFLRDDDGRPVLVAPIFHLPTAYSQSPTHPAWRQALDLIVKHLRAQDSPFYFQPLPGDGSWNREVREVIVPAFGTVQSVNWPWARSLSELGPRGRLSPLAAG